MALFDKIQIINICSILLISSNAFALSNQVNFSGNLIAPPACSINSGDNIDVLFGDNMSVDAINGINYEQPINYSITCEDGEGSSTLKLMLTGMVVSYDNAAVQTSNPNLGIRITQNGQPFNLNSSIEIDLGNPPKIKAVPVLKPGTVLEEGSFTASATLKAEYE